MYRTIHNEGIFEGPQMLDNNQLPDKAYKNSDNGGLMTSTFVQLARQHPTLLQILQLQLLKLS